MSWWIFRDFRPSSKGARVQFSGGKRTLVDGPFAETKELIAGYWIIKVKSRQEAIDWAMRVPILTKRAKARSRFGSFSNWRTSRPSEAIDRDRELDEAAGGEEKVSDGRWL